MTHSARPRWGIHALAALIGVAAVGLRVWVLARGGFYWDDLIFTGRASAQALYEPSYLFANYDGHVMPLTFLVSGILTKTVALQWVWPALVIAVLVAVLAVTTWRMLVVIAGARPSVLVIYLALMVSPMMVSAFAWWAAAINALPMMIAMTVIVTDVVRLMRQQCRNPGMVTWRALITLVIALGFFEKSIFIVPVAWVVAMVVIGQQGHRRVLVETWMRARTLWVAVVALSVVWGIAYLAIIGASSADQGAGGAGAPTHSVPQAIALTWRLVWAGLIPALVGGPWQWERWIPSPPWAVAPTWQVTLGAVVALVAVVVALRRRRGVGLIVASAAAYATVLQAPLMYSRTSPGGTSLELAQRLTYLPDVAMVLAVAAALVLVATPRSGRRRAQAAGGGVSQPFVGATTVVLCVVMVASAVLSTVRFSDQWRSGPTETYLANARKSLAANQSERIFDQMLPLNVLLPVAYPNNQISRVFGEVNPKPTIGVWTNRLLFLGDSGNFVDAQVYPKRRFDGGRGTCARPEVSRPTRMPLDGPLLQWQWYVQINYCATIDGEVMIGLEGGDPVTVPVRAGLHPTWVQLTGAGQAVSITPITPGLSLHVGAGVVGDSFGPPVGGGR